MIVERIVFNVLAFALFFVIFSKMIKRNDTNYTYVLIVQALGILISFIGLIFRINMPIILIVFTYLISILIPITIIIFERKGIYVSEVININLAKIYYKRGDIEKAKQILTNTMEKFPNSFLVHKELAAIFEENENPDIAIDEYIRATDVNPNDFNLKMKVVEMLKSNNRTDEAIRNLNEILLRKPDFFEASCALGDILYEQERYREAINVYLQAMEHNPYRYEIYYNLGIIFTAINDFQTAKEYFEKSAELNSLLYYAKFDLGQIAMLYNELDEAEEYFMECINEDDIADEVYYYLAYINILKGNKEDAIAYLNIAVEENEELYDKASKELVFKLIMNRINKPTSTAKERKPLNLKEKNTMKHLEKMCAVVGNLSHNDIKVLKNIREQEEREQEKQEDILREERE